MANNANAAIFLHASGQPLRIFVEPTELTFRPKLVRDLRSRGAVIAHYPTEAQVIIVDPESDAGKQFVEDWCLEPGKVVLHHDWVTRSIEEGRALLGHDDWGRMRLVTAQNGHAAIINPGHPLPTPPPDNGGHSHPPPNPGNAQLPAGAPIPGQMPLQANAIPAPAQNIPLDPKALAMAAQLLQNMDPAVLQNLLSQTPPAKPPPAASPAPGPSNHLAAYDGPQVAAPGVAATDFMMTPSSTSISASIRRHSRSTPDPPSSIPAKRRKSLGDKPTSSASSRSKGKERADMHEPPAKHHHRSPSPEEEYQSESAEEEHAGSPRQPDEIFIHDDGLPIAFWVQMETKQRGDLVQMIKASSVRNKGRVVSDIVEADIAVLAQDFTSKNFDHWNKIAIQNKKVAVQSRYIRQCVKDCALLDPDEFGVVAVSKPRGGRGRGRPPGAGNKRQEIPIAPPSPRAFRLSASPPPPKRTEGYQGGKFLYTSEETEYFRRYVPILVSRDPDVSNVFIGDKLHEKMPHHSARSWNSWLASKDSRTKFLAQCRGKANQLRNGQLEKHRSHKTTPHRHRGKAHETPERHATSQHADKPVSAKKPAPAELQSVVEGQVASQAEADNARDFDSITSFLANGGADNRTDEEVWQMLAKEHPARTAAGWLEFWLERGTAINEEVQRRMAEDDTPAA
ncbi:hypothetical protein FOMPIDRAFT_1058236 [Fomitopsis schrenkii]|uniref:BRCT domain-containing protein n=1 Tax=Fomitopsis schrenkii TaxID=2126942 RepID=S8G0F3_FOMSC|nr:hypothetical protein FOMPIDRAFT_1058236 [Fomitopsis schrenkii]